MDPDACLAELLELKESLKKKVDKYESWTDLAEAAPAEEVDELISELDELVNHIDALNGWLEKKGFLPAPWRPDGKPYDRNTIPDGPSQADLNAHTLSMLSETLWPEGNEQAEWTSEEIDNVATLLRGAGYGPGGSGKVDSSKPE